MAQAEKVTGLSPEKIERIMAAKKRRAEIDPSYENMTLEEFINWHPVGGISWEERAQRMKAAGIVDPELKELEPDAVPLHHAVAP